MLRIFFICFIIYSPFVYAIPIWKNTIRDGGYISHDHGDYSKVVSGHTHPGVDIIVGCGTKIYPIAKGVVVGGKWNTSNNGYNGGLGYSLLIKHESLENNNGTLYSLYLHMQDVPNITSGKVEYTDVIGHVGTTGFANRVCHTHFEVRHFSSLYYEGVGSGRCGDGSPNIYICGDIKNESWYKNNWTNPIEELPTNTNPSSLPNLSISSLNIRTSGGNWTHDSLTVSSSTIIEAEVKVSEKENVDINDEFQVRLFYSLDGGCDEDDMDQKLAGDEDINGIDGDDKETARFTFTSPGGGGAYYICAMVDERSDICESDEDNNDDGDCNDSGDEEYGNNNFSDSSDEISKLIVIVSDSTQTPNQSWLMPILRYFNQ